MTTYRYFKWDGSQELYDPEADELMRDLERNLMSYGDLSHALRLMQRGGLRDRQGRRLPSMQDLTQRLRQKRQEQLEKYNLGSVIDEIRQKLDDILAAEHSGIQKRLDEARQKAGDESGDLSPEMQQKLLKSFEQRAEQNSRVLDGLPEDIGGRIKELAQYDFIDAGARRQFQELMDMLKKNALESYGRDLVQKLQSMDPSSLAGLRHFIEAVNQMLEQRMKGHEPDFSKFMDEFGQYFGEQPPQNLDELIERLQNQISQARSLLNSMSANDRETLENMLDSMLDEATRMEMAKLASNLENLFPGDRLRAQYAFSGEESLSYTEALKLMESLQKMDQLENQLKESQFSRSIDTIDEKLLQEVMGNEAADELDRLRSITRILEEAGYIRWKDGKYELTPRGMRKIGQKALADIFAQLRRDRIGGHSLNLRGNGGERIEETRKLELGDDFDIHLQKTIMNAVRREAAKPPVKLAVGDFEVYCEEAMTRSATVLMLDLSLSMPMRGNFEAAKRVAVALDSLIRTQYPRDSLHIIGFSSYARRITKADLTCMSWDEFDPYTNIQHGLYVARRILSRERSTNKQIIMISDGEPTAHLEGGNIFFQYPPSLRTLQLTLREVRNCTQKGIIINTFMLESGRFLGAFVTQMARINKGRVFFTNADSLGQYLLVDYISNKKRKV
ncbi:MAG: VWA domain-containing protein [Chloroflexi bacterium]|nr:VWA domain-containing protein [Chloroflexota bacterium]